MCRRGQLSAPRSVYLPLQRRLPFESGRRTAGMRSDRFSLWRFAVALISPSRHSLSVSRPSLDFRANVAAFAEVFGGVVLFWGKTSSSNRAPSRVATFCIIFIAATVRPQSRRHRNIICCSDVHGLEFFVSGAYMFMRADLALPYLATARVLAYLLVS